MPLLDVPGSEGIVPFSQTVNDVPKLNVGVMLGATVTVSVVGKAHNPAVGVKVYVPEFWLSTDEGFQVPVMPFADVAGNTGVAASAQIVIDVPKLKVGVIFGLTVTVNVVGTAHKPAVGVNV